MLEALVPSSVFLGFCSNVKHDHISVLQQGCSIFWVPWATFEEKKIVILPPLNPLWQIRKNGIDYLMEDTTLEIAIR